jgi:thiamine transport system substrate-binding protein
MHTQTKEGLHMRKLALSFLLLAVGFVLNAPFSLAQTSEGSKLFVYTYDSFGAGKFIEQEFEKKFPGIDVVFVATGPSRKMLSQLVTERGAGGTPADVFLGEINDIPRAKKFDLFISLAEKDVPNLREIPKDLLIDKENTLIPYEHGFINLVYDSEKIRDEDLPRTFEQLTDPQYKSKLIVQDPRTSSVGHAFLLWTIAQYGEKYLDYWKRLLPNILSIQPGWSAAYKLFTKGEAPLVVSFSTDSFFNTRYKVLLLNSQAYRTVYGMGIVKGTDNPQTARAFLNFVLSTEVQEKIPTTEFVFPANPNALLPLKFTQLAVVPPKPVILPLELVAENDDRWLEDWAKLVVTGK